MKQIQNSTTECKALKPEDFPCILEQLRKLRTVFCGIQVGFGKGIPNYQNTLPKYK